MASPKRLFSLMSHSLQESSEGKGEEEWGGSGREGLRFHYLRGSPTSPPRHSISGKEEEDGDSEIDCPIGVFNARSTSSILTDAESNDDAPKMTRRPSLVRFAGEEEGMTEPRSPDMKISELRGVLKSSRGPGDPLYISKPYSPHTLKLHTPVSPGSRSAPGTPLRLSFNPHSKPSTPGPYPGSSSLVLKSTLKMVGSPAHRKNSGLQSDDDEGKVLSAEETLHVGGVTGAVKMSRKGFDMGIRYAFALMNGDISVLLLDRMECQLLVPWIS